MNLALPARLERATLCLAYHPGFPQAQNLSCGLDHILGISAWVRVASTVSWRKFRPVPSVLS
jgi:hypothetical protein